MGRATTSESPPRPGRPRSESSRRAILAAASELMLEHGLGAVSMEAVAERAEASKATIYRWWPSKESLALDALLAEWEPGEQARGPDTGSLAGDLMALLGPWARQLASKPYGRVIAALITTAQSDPRFADEYRHRFLEPRRAPARAALIRAVQRGEIPADADLEAALDMLYGPFYHRILHGHAPLGDGFAEATVGCVVAALSLRAPDGDT